MNAKTPWMWNPRGFFVLLRRSSLKIRTYCTSLGAIYLKNFTPNCTNWGPRARNWVPIQQNMEKSVQIAQICHLQPKNAKIISKYLKKRLFRRPDAVFGEAGQPFEKFT